MNDTAKLEKITVFTPGTHAGKRYMPGPDGHELEVTPGDAKILRDANAHVRPGAAPQTSPAVAEVPAAKVAVATRPQG